MNPQYASIKEQIEYGLDGIDAERTVNFLLRDLLYVHQTLGELVRFFHNPDHYPDLESVKQFIGNRNEGAFGPLSECYYTKLGDVIPKDILEVFNDGTFDNPHPPYYYEPTAKGSG